LRFKKFSPDRSGCNHSVPLFEKEGLGEILLDKSPSIPLSKGEVNNYVRFLKPDLSNPAMVLVHFYFGINTAPKNIGKR